MFFRARWLLLLIALVLAVDASLKWTVHSYIPLCSRSLPLYPYGGIGVFEDVCGVQFSIIHATNTGTLWGLFPQAPGLLACVRLVVVGVLLGYLIRARRQPALALPLSLILAGAIGNIVDFFLYGHVVDMFFFQFWGWGYPVFNVADSAIFLGVVWLVLRVGVGKGVGRVRRDSPAK